MIMFKDKRIVFAVFFLIIICLLSLHYYQVYSAKEYEKEMFGTYVTKDSFIEQGNNFSSRQKLKIENIFNLSGIVSDDMISGQTSIYRRVIDGNIHNAFDLGVFQAPLLISSMQDAQDITDYAGNDNDPELRASITTFAAMLAINGIISTKYTYFIELSLTDCLGNNSGTNGTNNCLASVYKNFTGVYRGGIDYIPALNLPNCAQNLPLLKYDYLRMKKYERFSRADDPVLKAVYYFEYNAILKCEMKTIKEINNTTCIDSSDFNFVQASDSVYAISGSMAVCLSTEAADSWLKGS